MEADHLRRRTNLKLVVISLLTLLASEIYRLSPRHEIEPGPALGRVFLKLGEVKNQLPHHSRRVQGTNTSHLNQIRSLQLKNNPRASSKNEIGQNRVNWQFSANYYIFIIDGLEPKLFDFKSSSQQQCCKSHEIDQLCQQDQASTCLCSKGRDTQ